jgi:GAF domain-containing protein
MDAGTRAPALGVVREAGLGFIAGLAAFAVVAVAVAAIDSGPAVAVLGAALVAVVVVIILEWGYPFGVPVVIAGTLAYDWFQFPPTHQKAFPGVADLADLIAYISIGVVAGVALADVRRRAADTERARHELANEQAALRRVATLVAREAPSADVFAVVTEEVARILDVDDARMFRYDAGASATVVAAWGRSGPDLGVGALITLDGDSVTARIQRSGRPARIDAYEPETGSLAAAAHEWGIRSAVGAPIVVEGKLWGAIVAASRKREPLLQGTESRMEEFTELVATAIANIEARTELAASRARLVAAADDERRRVVRDLHDGAQQRLVHTIVTLKMARTALDRGDDASTALVTEARAGERDSPLRPHLGRAAGRRRGARVAHADAGGGQRIRGTARASGRGERLLRRRGGADQCRQARPRVPRCRHGHRGERRAADLSGGRRRRHGRSEWQRSARAEGSPLVRRRFAARAQRSCRGHGTDRHRPVAG